MFGAQKRSSLQELSKKGDDFIALENIQHATFSLQFCLSTSVSVSVSASICVFLSLCL